MQLYSYSFALYYFPKKYERVCQNAPKMSDNSPCCGYWLME
ncbi:hypothetical protein H243_1727 [Klebsiella pneumoniae UHKPC04]|nr:hypothetical protein CSC25_0268 [Klebsiella pneumoniae]EGF63861.1 conserved domain protein [Klebsiella sp. MS 92-3]EOR17511.1 hypothetical protein H208_2114 [Klebsiella pneumoniae UHKPC23]EOY78354.1 hypothetical protein H231_1811 [Klebsiella pneumoniae UHKPC01]EOZ00166.1 hypothetical protein H236_1841 [Klebsiella pneumoniae UHKPC26]EOZ15101.1 hypothetical protein H243_1727 [Klebsiella pneumoniae UHKPC04]EPB05148.1 hypothetical protein H210_1606 [Klebsiella pneumoniae UHKPC05]EPB13004.1 hy